jgi:two-component system phosphate regulon response regulator PhoB
MPGTPHGGFRAAVVLIAGPDPAYLGLLEYVLEAEGFDVKWADIESDLLRAAAQTEAAILLLDGTQAKGPVEEVRGRLATTAATSQLRVIILVDRPAKPPPCAGGDHVLYLSKASHPHEIITGLRRALKGERPNPQRETLSYADVDMHLDARRVRRAGRDIHLTPIEYRLLRHFLEHPEQALSREELARAAWPAEARVGDRTVDVHLGRLRRALGVEPPDELIRTIWSVGYALSAKA